jgi:hypothetical protein
LFTLPLKEFTAERNALSAALKKDGQVADAVAVKALSAGAQAQDRSRVGQLTADLTPPGFEAIAALVPRSGSRPRGTVHPRVIPFDTSVRDGQAPPPKPKLTPAAQRAAARKVVDQAKRQLAAARTTARTSEAALKNAAARARLATDERAAAERQRAEVEARFERAVAAADAVVAEARRLAREAEDAAQAVTDAERDLELARHALDR